ncbi:coiled-coil alpha-helical rod protein 1-like [Haliotis rufescens]|uniref:coiled-coil alpha-helical rod protein 1-like n=1 Tax=Haliotis rufescens TaxID=6454 RepID=UPI00201F89ED|nr:coiled-coil alpha-helical rod protein 1-like [Haliotis rufescens]
MAAFLNKPSDFFKPNVPNMNPLELMPPSVFESSSQRKNVKTQEDPWQEVARAKEEFNKLKQEIENLRIERQRSAVVPETQAPKVHIVHQPSSKEETKYADELISRQSREIENLKSEIRSLQHEHKENMSDVERQMALQEREANHRVSGLEMAVRESEERYEQQVDRLSHQHQKEVDDINSALDNTTRELAETKSQYVARLRGLETEIESLRSESAATIAQLEAEVRSKSMLADNQNQQILQLKTYIGETEKTYQPAEVWRRERETLNNRIKIYAAEKDNLESNMELVNIRLKSMSEILNVQEAELSKAKCENISSSKQEALLLTRWRDKVFALLVQQKSADIVAKKNEQNWREKVKHLEEQLVSSGSRVEVLTHSLMEKNAQLQMEQNNCQRYQEEITQAQQVALCLDDNLSQNRTSAEGLQQLAQSVSGQFEEKLKVLQDMMGILQTHGQRISFAGHRVQMLQGQFARKEALLRLQAKSQDVDQETETETSPRADTSHLSQELERVLGERNLLASQIQQDAELLSHKLDMARAEYEGEITSLKQTVEDLEVSVQQKSQTCASLSEKLEQTQMELDDVKDRADVLRSELAKQEFATQTALEEQRKQDRDEYAEQLAEMDRKLNEARREHTKAVVSVRQLERQSGRERERLREEMQTVEEHFKRQVDKLQQQLILVEKERNMMMATLRQEGLLSKVRCDRGEPVTLQCEEVQTQPTANSKGEPITSVLEDLRSLTAAVLEEGDESEDEEEED